MNAVAGRCPTHVGGLSDEELVQLARGGNGTAFDAIVRRYRGPLVSYCRRWLDPHRAEEVVQHTLMKAFLCLRDDDRPLALRAWLYRVAHNAALNAIEKKGSDWEELDENYDGVPQPPYVAEQRARFLRVVDGIGELPDRQRDALVLNEFEGRCYAEIAAELGTSESGVRGLLRRARRQLRETAAAILPIPALREFVRSDAGRLQVDRAGELLTSAGAMGGVGVAGGFTKIAAGMLAAGTIAGGGTAIERHHEISQAAEPKAAESAPATPESVRAAIPLSHGRRIVAPSLSEADILALNAFTFASTPFSGRSGVRSRGAEGPPANDGIDRPATEDDESLIGPDAETPVDGTAPLLGPDDAKDGEPTGTGDSDGTADKPASEKTGTEKSDAPPAQNSPAAGEEPASREAGDPADDTAPPPSDDTATADETDSEPSAVPAIEPQRG